MSEPDSKKGSQGIKWSESSIILCDFGRSVTTLPVGSEGQKKTATLSAQNTTGPFCPYTPGPSCRLGVPLHTMTIFTKYYYQIELNSIKLN